MMLDVAIAYNRYVFLGNEFLTWIWFIIENDMQLLRQCDPEVVELTVGNRMVLENKLSNGKEIVTIRGDAAGLEEALLALSKGAVITEINLIYKSGVTEFHFTLKGESLSFSNLKLPECATNEKNEDLDALVLEKLYLYDKPFKFIDQLYIFFVKLRLSDAWREETLARMKQWLQPNA
jgi:hypothetical protein